MRRTFAGYAGGLLSDETLGVVMGLAAVSGLLLGEVLAGSVAAGVAVGLFLIGHGWRLDPD